MCVLEKHLYFGLKCEPLDYIPIGQLRCNLSVSDVCCHLYLSYRVDYMNG